MSGSDDMNFNPYDPDDEWDRDRRRHLGGSVAETEPFNPEYAEAPRASDWERGETWTVGPGNIIEIQTEIYQVWCENEGDYEDTGSAIAYFTDEAEANAYALRRNDVRNDYSTYTVETIKLGPPNVEYDGPIWRVDFDLQWHYDKHERRTIIDIARQTWHSGNQPGKAKVTRNNGRNFGVVGTDYEAVIALATETARQNVLAEAERREIAARNKANATRFRIDSQHEFG